ncbi:kinase-like domain-containing protein [Cantharellus anzutake]|uniref:kinase-like domain-containing protein n=1 Tax=Cantharellus anzutake TaxID=1750568 RepID=UPI00190444D6|nr:kinase-like domain-containing protein [Cantharellus anzutake]KAF8311228.1 kinase-like domain-containing protein [Cantharellus anzutake]
MADQTLASSPSSSLVVRDSHNLDRRIVFDIRDGRVIAPNLVRGGVVGESGTLVEVIHEVELSQEVVEQAVGRDDAEAAKHFVQRVERQLNVICSLDHINIARFQGWTMMLEDETWLRARVTYASCEGGKVMDYLSANVNADRQKLILGVSRGLSYLHSKDIVHGNLNPGNVRIDCGANDTHPIPRISGFGSSYAMTDVTPVRLIVEGACSVPLRYVAPEVLAGRGVPCDQKGDIWSLGCTSSQVFHASCVPIGISPFSDAPRQTSLREYPQRLPHSIRSRETCSSLYVGLFGSLPSSTSALPHT